MYASPQNPGITMNVVGSGENPYDNANANGHDTPIPAPRSLPQNMQIPSLGYLPGSPQNLNYLSDPLNVQHPGSKTSIDNMRPHPKGSLLNPNNQGRVPSQNNSNQFFYNHGQKTPNGPYQQQSYGPGYQGINPSTGQSSAQTNQQGTMNNGYDDYYYYYHRDNTRDTLQSHGSHSKGQYSQTHNRRTQPCPGGTQYPSTHFYQQFNASGEIDQLFCDNFSSLQISPEKQLPPVIATGQTFNFESQKSQDEANAIYYDTNYQENSSNPIPGKVSKEQSYYYAPEPQYPGIERVATPHPQGFGNYNDGDTGLGYTSGEDCEKSYANPFGEKRDLGYLPGTNAQDSNGDPGKFDGVSINGNYSEKK